MDPKLERLLTPDEPLPPMLIRLHPAVKLTGKQLLELSAINDAWDFELTSEGDLILMTPEGSEAGNQNFEIGVDLGVWARADGSGIGFGSSAGFRLPNRALRSPDASWIRRERWEALTPAERRRAAPLCPDFVIELRSRTDRLRVLQAKMGEYIDNGAQLGWLIDPIQRKVHIYRPGAPVEVLDNPNTVSGDPILPGFTLSLTRIWSD